MGAAPNVMYDIVFMWYDMTYNFVSRPECQYDIVFMSYDMTYDIGQAPGDYKVRS